MSQNRADAVEPALRRQDSVGPAVSVARNWRQKTLSHAWWCTGFWCATRQQERAKTWGLYAGGHRETQRDPRIHTQIAGPDFQKVNEFSLARVTQFNWLRFGDSFEIADGR